MKFLMLILILAIVLIAGCSQQTTGIDGILKTSTCPFEGKMKEIITNSIFNFYNTSQRYIFVVNDAQLDGWTLWCEGPNAGSERMDETLFNCRKGTEEGENINYLYCEHSICVSSENLIAKKDIISSVGNIEEKIKYKIKFPIVINPNTNFTVIELKCEKIS